MLDAAIVIAYWYWMQEKTDGVSTIQPRLC